MNKKDQLKKILGVYDSLIVAYSGGVDSTFLLTVASEVLGNKVVAVTADSALHPLKERAFAIGYAKKLGIKHILFHSKELETNAFIENPKDRCYICKRKMFRTILKIASKEKIHNIAHGANLDDLDDFRPGMKAAEELDVLSPLMDAGLTKEEIRRFSREMHLETWNKPSMACLASRIPYGTLITENILKKIESAEDFLSELGFVECRARVDGNVIRIEINPDFIKDIIEESVRKKVVAKMRRLGFSHVAVDLEGYIQGSMNRD